MKTEFGAHPIMILRFLKPFWFILVLPLLKGGIEFLIYRKITGILRLEALAVSVILILGYLSFKAFKISFSEDEFSLKQGFFIRTETAVPLSRISSIGFSENPLDRLFRVVKVSVNTESGIRDQSDFVLYIRKGETESLKKLFGINDKKREVKPPVRNIAIMSLADSSALGGIIIGVPIINRIGKLLGVAIDQVLFERLNDVSSSINTYFPPIVNLITIVFALLYFVSFMSFFIRNVRLTIGCQKEGFCVKRGIFFKRQIFFRKKSVNNILIEQRPIMRFFKKSSFLVSVGGYGDKKGENAVLAPTLSKEETEKTVNNYFPDLKPTSPFIRPTRSFKSFRRFVWLPALYEILAISALLAVYNLFPIFQRLALFVFIVLSALICYFTTISYLNYSRAELSFGSVIVAKGSKGLSFNELRMKKERLGVIRLMETPADRKYRTCKIKITVRSERADSIRVRNLDKKSVTDKIFA